MWEFDEKFQTVKTWFGRTVIRSAGELNYGQAQQIHDDTLPQAERSKLSNYKVRLAPHILSFALLLLFDTLSRTLQSNPQKQSLVFCQSQCFRRGYNRT
jgi:exoribonuclease R